MSNNQPVIDHYRRSVSVPKHLMPSLLAAHAGKLTRSPATSQLEAAGVIAASRLDPLVRELIDVVTDPGLVVTTETDLAGSHGLATIWRAGHRAVIGHRDSHGRFQLLAAEPQLLVFDLAQTVQLVPRPSPTFSGGFQVSPHILTLVESLAATEPARAEHELLAAGVSQTWVDRILATLIMRRSLWTVESIWLGDRRRREEARLAVLDGGFGGYWRLSQKGQMVSVVSAGFDELLDLLAALVPEPSGS